MKAIRTQIIKPVDIPWTDFSRIMSDLQYKSAKILNHCMSNYYLWQTEKEAIKQAEGKYPSLKDFPMPTGRLYHEARAMFPEISSNTVTSIVRKAELRWKTDCKQVFFSMEKSLSSFRKTHPLLVKDNQWRMEKDSAGNCVLDVTFFSREYAGDAPARIKMILFYKGLNSGQKAVFDRILSGEYKKSAIQIARNPKKSKWFVTFVYEPEKQELALDPEKICGIDLGVKFTFFCAARHTKDRLAAHGDEIALYRQKIRHRRRSISQAVKFSTRKGKGRNHALKPVLAIGEKERRFRDTKYHQYSRAIIDFAVKHGCGTIQLENLDGLKSAKIGNFILKDWAISALHEKLGYKAQEAGIKINWVKAAYTSQRCSTCGYIEDGNRTEQEKFKCLVCGFEENADYNAALNLATPDIEKIISESEKVRTGSSQKKQMQSGLQLF